MSDGDIFRVVKRADLIGKYLGHTAQKTQKVIDSCRGGVMFIDEAYSLGNSEGRDIYSKECLDTLNQNLTENTNYEFMTNGFQSVNDGLDYVECVNNNCSKLGNENMENKEKDLVKDKKSNNTNVMMKNLDILVSLVYIFLLVVLLLGSVIKRDANNLINILIITLVYLFYQIYMSYKN